MRKLNGRRFGDPLQRRPDPLHELSTASGSGPRPLEILAGPQAPSAGLAISRRIVVAKPTDLKFLSDLQKKFSNALGYLPTKALAWYVEQKRVGLAFENDEPAGYVLGRTHYRYQPLMRPITQAAVAMDAQRRHHGIALVQRVIEQAQAAKQIAVQASCAADLDSNDFWSALGFQAIDILKPDNARGREIIVWRKCLVPRAPDWFLTPPPVAGHRAKKVIRTDHASVPPRTSS